MSQLTPDVSAFVIVPVQDDQTYGSLHEIKAEADEIFISGAIVDNIDIIDAITASKLKAQGSIVSKATTTNVGVQSTTVVSNAVNITNTNSSTANNSSSSSTSSSSSSSSSSSNGGYSY